MARYLTEEWLDAVRDAVAAAGDDLAALDGITTSLMSVVTDCPPDGEARALLYRIEEGALVDARVGPAEGLAGEAAEFVVHGDYDTFVRINKGELDSRLALVQRAIRMEGSFVKALRYVKPMDAFNAVVRRAPTEY